MANLNSLMSGGYEPDNEMDMVSDFDLWVEEHERRAAAMNEDQLRFEIEDARFKDELDVASIYEEELKSRGLIVDVPACSTLADEPYYQDDPDHEDRRKDWLENYAANCFEQDELPF